MAYIKKNKKSIKKIIFISIFQLGIKKNEIYKTLKTLGPYECYFFIDGFGCNFHMLAKVLKEIFHKLCNFVTSQQLNICL